MNSCSLISLMIVDDHLVYRTGLRFLLEYHLPDLVLVVSEAENGEQAISTVKNQPPDIVLMDIQMPKVNGIEATKAITKQFPATKVIGISMFNESNHLFSMITAGAKGFLLKNTDVAELKIAITTVSSGGSYFAPETAVHFLEKFETVKAEKLAIKFTEKEIQIIKLICQGCNNKTIADKLRHKKRTIDNYREQIMQKIDGRNCADLFNFAIKSGIYKVGQ